MTIIDNSPAEAAVPSDDLSWMPVSAASAVSARVEEQMANQMTTLEGWLSELRARSVHHRKGRHRKGRRPM